MKKLKVLLTLLTIFALEINENLAQFKIIEMEEMKPSRGKAKFVHDINNITLVHLKPLEAKESTTIFSDDKITTTDYIEQQEDTTDVMPSSTTISSSTSTTTESLLKALQGSAQAKIAARSRSRQVNNRNRINLLQLQVVDRNRVGKIQARIASKSLDSLRPKPFRKYADLYSSPTDKEYQVIQIQPYIPRYQPEKKHLTKTSSASYVQSVASALQASSNLNEIVEKIQKKPYKKFKSKCRCEKIQNCKNLQISIARCPTDYFMCCF